MKNLFRVFALFTISLVFVLTACNKEKTTVENDIDYKTLSQQEDFVIEGNGRFERVITKRLIKPDDCRFIVSGTIEYRMNGEVMAIVDFGNGTCDNIATKTVRGKTTRFKLDANKGDSNYRKVITEPLVKLEGCDYIVSGIIEFYKDETWVVTIDFGDGECDEWATKTWDGGSKVFSMAKP